MAKTKPTAPPAGKQTRATKAVKSSVRKKGATRRNGRRYRRDQDKVDESVYASETTTDVQKKLITTTYRTAARLKKARQVKKQYKDRSSASHTKPGSIQRISSQSTSAQYTGKTQPQKHIPYTRSAMNNRTIQQMRKKAIQKKAAQNKLIHIQKSARSLKKTVTAAARGAVSVCRSAKTMWMLVGAVGGGVFLIACLIAIIVAVISPFSFLFGGNTSVEQYPSLAEVANDINADYNAKFDAIINSHQDVDDIEIVDYETDSATYVAGNWKDILSVWSINNDIYRGDELGNGEPKEIGPDKESTSDELPYVMTDENITSLTNMFWQMNDITFEVVTEEVPAVSGETALPQPTSPPTASSEPVPSPTSETVTKKTLVIQPVSKDYLWGADYYHFDDRQMSWLAELMSDSYGQEWSKLLLGVVGTEITSAQAQLLASLDGPAATIALNASSRLGHPYSKEKRGQGLYVDCSYLVRWCYQQAGYSWMTAGTAAEQARWCDNNGFVVERSELQAGDLLFYSFVQNGRYKDVSHVAVYIGRASDGKEYMIDASSSNGFVIFREVFSDHNLVMCGHPLMYLD